MMDCVTKQMRDACFNDIGVHLSDQEVYAWFVRTILKIAEGIE